MLLEARALLLLVHDDLHRCLALVFLSFSLGITSDISLANPVVGIYFKYEAGQSEEDGIGVEIIRQQVGTWESTGRATLSWTYMQTMQMDFRAHDGLSCTYMQTMQMAFRAHTCRPCRGPNWECGDAESGVGELFRDLECSPRSIFDKYPLALLNHRYVYFLSATQVI